MLGDETTVPAKQRRWRHNKATPAMPVQHPTRRGKESTIRRLQIGPMDLAPQDPQLVTQYHQLQVLATLRASPQNQ
jgi:hypothetical protein